MTIVEHTTKPLSTPEPEDPLAEAHLAAAAFLARYQGRTLDADRHDLRVFSQWAIQVGLDVVATTRPHIEMYVRALEERRLAAATIDRRLSTVCGFYRFAHIDGRIGSNPAQYCDVPKYIPQRRAAWIASSWAGSCSPNASTGPTPRWPSCSA